MSDDDCDVFHMPVIRANNAMSEVPVMPEFECKEDDYDFIESSETSKKTGKVVKQTVKSKIKKGSQKKGIENEDANTDQLEALAPDTRASLSPVSQMIHEIEQKEKETKAKQIGIDSLPVARRTRSSLGKTQIIAVEEDIQEMHLVSPPKIRARRTLRSNPKKKNDRSETESVIQSALSRTQAAEIAARSQVIDSIDLVSAVVPRVEGFINLDSDEDNAKEDTEKALTEPMINLEDDNPLIEINLNWHGEIQSYKLRQYQKFSHMFKEVSQRNGVPESDVEITMDDNFLSITESPQSVGLKFYHILCGHVKLKSQRNPTQPKEVSNLRSKSNKFKLKIQSDKWKKPLIIPMKKSEAFKMLYIKCAEEIECDVRDFKLFFDGDLLELDDTPKNQDMEGNEIIDLRFK